jgi:hypothetical protein
MELVLRPDIRSHTDDKNVSKASNCRYDPDKHSLNNVCQEVLERRNSICVWLTAANVGGIATVLKLLKISAGQRRSKIEIELRVTIL